MTTYGNCVSCNFPILVQGSNPVSCPACSTVNQPGSISFAPLAALGVPVLLGIGAFVIGLIGKQAAKKGAYFAAGHLAEPAAEYGVKWAKGKLKGEDKKK